MGRLFWKFFGFIWLAQLAGIVAIGSVFWFTQRHSELAGDELDSGPGAGSSVRAAAALFKYGGTAALAEWAAQERPAVFAVDETGKDVLGRVVDPAVLDSARHLHAVEPQSPLVAMGLDANSRPYLLFTVREPPQGALERPRVGGLPDRGPPDRGPPGHGPPGHGPPGRAPPGSGPGSRGPAGLPPLGPTLATLLASLLTAAVLAWYVAKPIRNLRSAFDVLSSGNLSARVGHLMDDRHDELADLGRDFDRMAERLQAAMEAQRRLLHDVSHEIRSPLARLQAAAGLMRQRSADESGMIGRIEEEIARIDRLVGDLLKLSRIEAGEHAEEIATVDLRELLQEIVTDANFEAQIAGQTVVWKDTGTATVSTVPGRSELLRGAIENIVRNALKHAPDAREVILETSHDQERRNVLVRVLDGGPGVPPDELETLFRPFYRSSAATRPDGHGLGLAIARRSVEAHGGTIRVRNRAEGGLCVELSLPL